MSYNSHPSSTHVYVERCENLGVYKTELHPTVAARRRRLHTANNNYDTGVSYRLAETSTVEAEVEAVPVDGVSMVTSEVTLSRALISLPSCDSGAST